MSGITSGIGLFSGINTAQLIEQLLALEARPRVLAQQRAIQIQTQQAAYLDLNSRLGALHTAARAFAINRTFTSATVSSSDPEVLTAVASPGATLGNFTFMVDRLVTTQSELSRGFSDRDRTGLGATEFIFEGFEARLDRDTQLAELNAGQGVQRGRIVITDHNGDAATIDLSRAASVQEVLDAINASEDIDVTASVEGGGFIIRANGAGTITVANAAGSTTATSLGIAGSSGTGVLTGSSVYALGNTTSLTALNDGNGVRLNTAAGSSTADFTIRTRDGTTYDIDIGHMYAANGEETATPVADIAALRERIEDQTDGNVTVVIDNNRLKLVDSSTPTGADDLTVTDISGAAADLRIVGATANAELTGGVVFAGLNSTLISNLTGGQGLADNDIVITDRDGVVHSFNLPTSGSVTDIIAAFSNETGGDITAALDATGTRLVLTDHTGGSSSNLIIEGGAADILGLTTDPAGIDADSTTGQRLQHAYIALGTRLSTLRDGQGIGTGSFRITDAHGVVAVVDVGNDAQTIDDIITEINSRPIAVIARINDTGDGIIIEEDTTDGAGSVAIRIEDVTGSVARNLRIAGQAEGPDAENFIDGTFETRIELDPTDTLDDINAKINASNAGVASTVISDGSTVNPFRLTLASRQSGRIGRYILDTGGVDLGLSTLSRGQDARVFFGSDDPARAVLLTSSTNTVSGVVNGLSLDLHRTSSDPVQLSVTRDTASIEAAVGNFITAFNDIIGRIDAVTDYDPESQRRGALLGDSTVNLLRSNLISSVQGRPLGVDSQYQRLSEVGVKVVAGGRLELDADKLRDALETDPEAVAALFAARQQLPREDIEIAPGITVNNTGPDEFSQLGVAELVAQLTNRYTNTIDGIFTTRNQSFDTQIRQQRSRIDAMTVRLESRRQILTNQFIAMERAIAQLQGQQGALATLANLAG